MTQYLWLTDLQGLTPRHSKYTNGMKITLELRMTEVRREAALKIYFTT